MEFKTDNGSEPGHLRTRTKATRGRVLITDSSYVLESHAIGIGIDIGMGPLNACIPTACRKCYVEAFAQNVSASRGNLENELDTRYSPRHLLYCCKHWVSKLGPNLSQQ